MANMGKAQKGLSLLEISLALAVTAAILVLVIERSRTQIREHNAMQLQGSILQITSGLENYFNAHCQEPQYFKGSQLTVPLTELESYGVTAAGVVNPFSFAAGEEVYSAQIIADYAPDSTEPFLLQVKAQFPQELSKAAWHYYSQQLKPDFMDRESKVMVWRQIPVSQATSDLWSLLPYYQLSSSDTEIPDSVALPNNLKKPCVAYDIGDAP